ncbi:MAG: hypothetical protein ABI844_07270 [Saprospiraceae bacterium]
MEDPTLNYILISEIEKISNDLTSLIQLKSGSSELTFDFLNQLKNEAGKYLNSIKGGNSILLDFQIQIFEAQLDSENNQLIKVEILLKLNNIPKAVVLSLSGNTIVKRAYEISWNSNLIYPINK